MKKNIGRWLSFALPLLLGVFLIVYTYNQYTAEQLKVIAAAFREADYYYIFVSLVISTLGVASRAYRWKYSLEHMGYKTSFLNNFFAVSIGYLLNMAIPRSGELSRALVLKKYNDIPFDKGFGTIVGERIVDTIILLLLVILAFFVQFDVVKAFILDKIPVEKTIWLLIICSLVLIAAVSVYFYSNLRIVIALKQKISGLKEGLLSILHMEKKWQFLAHTVFIWVSYIWMFYITIFALDGTSHLGFGAVLTSFIVGSLVIAITSSGFGTYPVLMAKILFFYNVAWPVGSAFGWIVWASQILLVLVTGALSFLLIPIFNRKK